MSEIIFESTEANIQEFIKGRELIKLVTLLNYITSTAKVNRPPTDTEKEFIEIFFTNIGWAEHVAAAKRKLEGRSKYFESRDKFDLQMIQSILSFEVNQRTLTKLEKVDRDKRLVEVTNKLLKLELKLALSVSMQDGEFSKIDGFINLAKVLVKHKLIELPED